MMIKTKTTRRYIKMNDILKYSKTSRVRQIGNRIKNERKKRKLSQQELADTISTMLNSDPDCKGIGQNTVCNWEKGINLPPLDKLIILSEIFDCDIGYLLEVFSAEVLDVGHTLQCHYRGLHCHVLHRCLNTNLFGLGSLRITLLNVVDHEYHSTSISLYGG